LHKAQKTKKAELSTEHALETTGDRETGREKEKREEKLIRSRSEMGS
jgi:hypothetical protein